MFWFHFFHWLALVMALIAIPGVVLTVIFDEPGYLIFFIFGFPGIFLCLAIADDHRPVIHCTAKPGDMVVWGGHYEGRSSDWWVFIPTSDSNKFCEVHSRDLYNMGNGYKLGQTYNGILVDRP